MLALFSEFLDQALRTDEGARRRLQAMGRRTIRLALLPFPDMGLRIEDGKLTVEAAPEAPDLTIRGHWAAFARYAIHGRAEDIHLQGEGEIAQEFRDFLASLDIDWEELLSRGLGDAPARLLARGAKEFAQAARRFGAAVESNTGDYLHEESGLLPPAGEVEEFLREVDRLRDDLARLELRLDRLAS